MHNWQKHLSLYLLNAIAKKKTCEYIVHIISGSVESESMKITSRSTKAKKSKFSPFFLSFFFAGCCYCCFWLLHFVKVKWKKKEEKKNFYRCFFLCFVVFVFPCYCFMPLSYMLIKSFRCETHSHRIQSEYSTFLVALHQPEQNVSERKLESIESKVSLLLLLLMMLPQPITNVHNTHFVFLSWFAILTTLFTLQMYKYI